MPSLCLRGAGAVGASTPQEHSTGFRVQVCEGHGGTGHVCPCLALACQRWQEDGQSVCSGGDITKGRYVRKVSTRLWTGYLCHRVGGIGRWEVQIYACALKRCHWCSVWAQTRALGSSLGTGLTSEHRRACLGRLYLPKDAC